MKLFLIISLLSLAQGRLDEGTFRKCKRDSERLEKCLIKHVEEIRDKLKKGMPEISVPQLEPFIIHRLDNLATAFPFLKIRGYASNIVARGLGDTVIESFKLYQNVTAEVTVLIPKLDVTAEYTSTDNKALMFIPLPDQTGTMTGTFFDTRVHMYMRAKLDEDSYEELEYLRVAYLKAEIHFGKASTFRITPHGRGLYAKATGAILNFAPTRVLSMIGNSINKNAAQHIKKYLNKILDNLPLQDVVE